MTQRCLNNRTWVLHCRELPVGKVFSSCAYPSLQSPNTAQGSRAPWLAQRSSCLCGSEAHYPDSFEQVLPLARQGLSCVHAHGCLINPHPCSARAWMESTEHICPMPMEQAAPRMGRRQLAELLPAPDSGEQGQCMEHPRAGSAMLPPQCVSSCHLAQEGFC